MTIRSYMTPRVRNYILLFFLLTRIALPQSYTFTQVVDATEFTLIIGQTIAPNGAVLLSGLPRGGSDGSYVWLGGVLTRLPDVTGVRVSPSALSMNSSGTIAANVILNDLSGGVFNLSNGQIKPVHTVPAPYVGAPNPRINEAGDVAFAIGTPLNSRVILVSGSETRIIAELSGNLAGAQLLFDVDINNRGQVAFAAGVGDPNKGGLFLFSNGALSRIVPEGPNNAGLVSGLNAPSINDAGIIVFEARDESLREVLRIYYPDGRVQTFARGGSSIDGPPFVEVRRPAINNRNVVAFFARHESANPRDHGIYALRNGTWSKVIRVGDALFGSTVRTIDLPRGEYLADNDHILFHYSLVNGAGGVAVAVPGAGPAQPPVVSQGGVLNAASFVLAGQPGHAISPGAVVSIFGSSFAQQLAVAAGSPLPSSLDGVSVTFNGTPAPLFFTANGQINAQVPFSINGPTVEVKVRTPAGESAVQTVQLTSTSPALYTMNQQGSGPAIAVFANSATLVGAAGVTQNSRSARAGDTITLYANGLGAVDPPIAAGANSCNPDGRCASDYSNLVLRRVVVQPTIEIGGIAVPAANILFAGLAPEFVGLYQIDLTLPTGLPVGNTVPVIVRQGSTASRSDVTIAIQ